MKKLFKVIISISFVFYLFVLMALLFLESRGPIWSDLSLMEYIKQSSNFIPFKTISTYVAALFDGNMNLDIPIKNLLGNIVMFMPMGLYLPYFLKKINTARSLSILMLILLLFVEAIQVITRRGSFDIDDLILNMSGALLGFAIWKAKNVQKLFN